ncbi:NADH-quinone oxidoreductase subunit J [Nocardiopsis changdeensis]|uniref:NADH-quinone oxidoreductase subunit J n=1 Tax=Nocardiopsis changdeensis TaxID=2831969 RepID=A0ABX8BJR2_9ACTN|nr:MULTISPECIES: NADH-quinone oxidoreductase subunit J [Nocardiopsis]QUX22242.1 NADH-quinone oxidoreductase subunit J [Nocardiopsis changdeensis]QYX38182.1 NADH-quinone oxidoreductase subunit J [Nocardiopsis sp. MT53]
MTPSALLASPLGPTHEVHLAAPIGGGEASAFWILGTVVLLGALGVVFSRKAVHSAMSMALTMVGLAIFYGINAAPFLMVVQIVVYTGAVLMLFLFVLMLIGVSSADSLKETLGGQRLLTAVVALCFVGALATGITRISVGDPVGLAAGTAAAGGSIPWIAGELLLRYVVAFEATAALLVTAVLGALVLAHTARTKKRRTQREISEDRIRGDHPTPLPGPGTYARHNAIDMPALLPDGQVARLSLNPVLTARDPEYQSRVPDDVRAGRPPLPGGGSDSAHSKEGEPTAGAEAHPHEAGAGDRAQENGDGQEVESTWTR